MSGTLIEAYSQAYVDAGGLAVGTTVSGFNAELYVYGGTARNTLLTDQGQLYVTSGGVTSGTRVTALTVETAGSGGTLVNATIDANGAQDVDFGGIASGTKIAKRGSETVSAGGLASAATISQGGDLAILSGGTADGTNVLSGGYLLVLPGAAVSGTTSSTGAHVVSTGTIIFRPGSGYAVYPGAATGQTVSGANAFEAVLAGGTASNGTIGFGADLTIDSGGKAVGETISGGSATIAAAGKLLAGAVIGGDLLVTSGGTDSGTSLTQYSDATIAAGGAASALAVDNASLVVSAGATLSGVTISGYNAYAATITIAAGAHLSGTLTFAGAGTINFGATPTNTISGFVAGDEIQLTNATYAAGETVSVTSAGLVTISGGGKSYNLHIAGATVGETGFSATIGNYGEGGILLTTANTAAIAAPRPAMTFLRPRLTPFGLSLTLAAPATTTLHAETEIAARPQAAFPAALRPDPFTPAALATRHATLHHIFL
jgi:autotransporter passenger strand-loop-strand repeat protein